MAISNDDSGLNVPANSQIVQGPITIQGDLVVTGVSTVTGIVESGVVGLIADLASINLALALKAPLASPHLTGVPTAPTAAADTSTTQHATTAFVINQGYRKRFTDINVRDFGAAGGTDSTAAFVAAWSAAIATSGSTAIYIPSDTLPYIVTQAMAPFVGKAVAVYGDGPNSSVVQFDTTSAGDAFVTWEPGAGQTTTNFLRAHDFAIISTNGTIKKGLKIIGSSFGSHFSDIRIQLHTVGDIACEIQGWDQTMFTSCFFDATYTVRFNKVTVGVGTGSGWCDYFLFVGCRFWSSNDTQALFSFENGVNCTRMTVIGCTFLGGTDMFKFVSSGVFYTFTMIGCGWENGVVNSATPVLHGFAFDIQPAASAHDFTLIGFSTGSAGAQGIRARNLNRITIKGGIIADAWTAASHIILDIDNTCDNLSLENVSLFQDTHGLITLGSQFVLQDGLPLPGGSNPQIPVSARYARRAADVNTQQMTLAGGPIWKSSGSEITLTAGSSFSCPSPGYMDTPDNGATPYAQARVFVDAQDPAFGGTHEYGLFATYQGGIVALGTLGANTVMTDTAGKLCVLFAGSTNQLIIKNRLAVTVRVKVVID